MTADLTLYLVAPGVRPPYYQVAKHLWGPDANIDSDGNSASPDDCQWTELSLSLRDSAHGVGVHVDPISNDPLVLAIRSVDADLVRRAAEYLRDYSGGTIREHVAST